MNTAKSSLLLSASLAAMLVMTGCASKKATVPATVTPTTGTIDSSSSSTASNGANTNGLGDQSALGSQQLDANGNPINPNGNSGVMGAQDALRAALLDRVVHFEFDSSDISDRDVNTLSQHAGYLRQNSAARVTLAGHTDERGTREYNMALGERRAKAVQAFLLTNGVNGQQIDTVSYGKEVPVNEGHNDGAWAENRRVEIKYDAGEP